LRINSQHFIQIGQNFAQEISDLEFFVVVDILEFEILAVIVDEHACQVEIVFDRVVVFNQIELLAEETFEFQVVFVLFIESELVVCRPEAVVVDPDVANPVEHRHLLGVLVLSQVRLYVLEYGVLGLHALDFHFKYAYQERLQVYFLAFRRCQQ